MAADKGRAAMKLATFNINGIKARIEALPAWLAQAAPDVVCLQEIKSVDEALPARGVRGHGLPGRNPRAKGLQRGGDPVETAADGYAARACRATTATNRPAGSRPSWTAPAPLRVCGLYLPNGNPAPGPKYDYKLAWMARMEARVRELLAAEEPFVCLGDYNVIPQADRRGQARGLGRRTRCSCPKAARPSAGW